MSVYNTGIERGLKLFVPKTAAGSDRIRMHKTASKQDSTCHPYSIYHMYFPGQIPAGLNYLQYTLGPANAAGTGHSTAETIKPYRKQCANLSIQ